MLIFRKKLCLIKAHLITRDPYQSHKSLVRLCYLIFAFQPLFFFLLGDISSLGIFLAFILDTCSVHIYRILLLSATDSCLIITFRILYSITQSFTDLRNRIFDDSIPISLDLFSYAPTIFKAYKSVKTFIIL